MRKLKRAQAPRAEPQRQPTRPPESLALAQPRRRRRLEGACREILFGGFGEWSDGGAKAWTFGLVAVTMSVCVSHSLALLADASNFLRFMCAHASLEGRLLFLGA